MRGSSAIAVQQQLRRLVINRAVNMPRAYSSYYPRAEIKEMRSFHTSQSMQTRRDTSTIDFAYMPQMEFDTPRQSEVLRVPILPDNSTAPGRGDEVTEFVIRPEIATVSANGTHIDSPSAMFEVVDNHAIELSPFDLTNKVTTAATEAAAKMTGMSTEQLKEPGMLKELWNSMLDDMFGPSKVAKA